MCWHRIVQKAASIGRYLEADNWQQYVFVDNNLATGQNPGSSEASDRFADSWTTMAAHHSRSFAHRDTAVEAITDVAMSRRPLQIRLQIPTWPSSSGLSS